MGDVRPLKLFATGAGAGELRECADGDGEYWVVAPYCTVGGTANALTLSLQHGLGKPSAYRAGQQFRFRASLSNTGAATINVAGLGAKTAVTVTGAALPAGYIRTDVDTTITYDAVSDRFVVGREIERGANASGEYVRLADGEQICRSPLIVDSAASITIAAAGGFRGNASPWIFPAAFSSAPHAPCWSRTSNNLILGLRVLNTTTVQPDYWSAVSVASVGAGYQSTATGRWY